MRVGCEELLKKRPPVGSNSVLQHTLFASERLFSEVWFWRQVPMFDCSTRVLFAAVLLSFAF